MSPKFKGDLEDWLDDESESGGTRFRSATRRFSHAKAESLPENQANAVVVEVFPKQCRVRMEQDGKFLLCSYRRAGVIKKGAVRERSFVAVGDRVLVQEVKSQGVIEGVCVRRNKLSRPAPGREGTIIQHVIAANLDQVVIVASSRQPDFTAGLVDRFLIGIQAAGIEPLICITKMDLALPDTVHSWSLYRDLGFNVIEVCTRQGLGITELRESLKGKSVLFCGESGVGKTSLLRALLEKEIGRVAEISEATGKGRHTTTGTILLGGPDNSQWMDSPGVREFGLAEVSADELIRFFPEFKKVSCAFSECRHLAEAGCQAGSLPRHASYVRILKSLLEG